MQTQEQVETLTRIIARQRGRVDAMMAALTGILEAARENPQLQAEVRDRLEQRYSLHLARNDDPGFMHGFETALDCLESYLD